MMMECLVDEGYEGCCIRWRKLLSIRRQAVSMRETLKPRNTGYTATGACCRQAHRETKSISPSASQSTEAAHCSERFTT